jgi:cation diffusion facilitator family transporter
MLEANARNMRNDVLTSSVVLTGLFFTAILKMPVLDSVVALGVSIWIMKIAYGIFMETTTDLMDGLKNPEIYKKIIAAVESVEGASNPHRMRIRKIGAMYMMELDIEVDGLATVYQSHAIAHQVEEALRETIDNLYDVVIHVEPAGHEQHDEPFGISSDTIL